MTGTVEATGKETRIIKEIKVSTDKCIGCRACEMACSGFHAMPKYSSTNPARSRIRVIMDDLNDIYLPIRATAYASAECPGRSRYVLGGREYKECNFCGASCSARDLFKDPDSGLPLICDMCEDDPTLTEPMCVQVCRVGALTYVEREESVTQEEVTLDEIKTCLEVLVSKHGISKVVDGFARISQNSKI